ncbi:hypothetical protein ABZ478_19610 [Streptomyces sp. NPDC005706]|uniref:hypothetical protein n=1 Tax=Streptomyces sp. NPDC005706 TaxID=3157169 RepID=UPI0033D0D4F7
MTMHYVLLGPGPEAIAIKELARLGHEITVLYTERNRAAVESAADLVKRSGSIPSYGDLELAWSTLLHLGTVDDVEAVIPSHELAVTSAAILNQLLGTSATLGPATALAGRDKALQKSLWTESGVPTARFATITNEPHSVDQVRSIIEGLRAPYIVKPPALGGSTLVTSCPTAEDVFQVLKDNEGLRHAVIEERQDGPEWHFDGTLVDGRVHEFMVSRYLAPLIETRRGLTNRSVAYPPSKNTDLYQEARRFTQAAIDALNGTRGVFHLEVFGSPGRFVAGELAWRPSGALANLVADHTIGVDLWRAHIQLLARADVTVHRPRADSVFGFACLPVKPGVRNTVTRSDIASFPGVRHVRMRIPPGETMSEPLTSTVCVAMVLVEGQDLDSCVERIDSACRRTRELHELRSG